MSVLNLASLHRDLRSCSSKRASCRLHDCVWQSGLWGHSLKLLEQLEDDSVDFIMTSPPFALLRRTAYGNEDQGNYVAWLAAFGQAPKRVLKPTGSLVIDLGNAYVKGNRPWHRRRCTRRRRRART